MMFEADERKLARFRPIPLLARLSCREPAKLPGSHRQDISEMGRQ